MKGKMWMWTPLARKFIYGAAMSAKKASALEEKLKPGLDEELQATVISAVVLSATFMEAVVNEFFASPNEGYQSTLDDMKTFPPREVLTAQASAPPV